MTGIIVDDEAKSRSILKTLCEEYCEGLEIIGMANAADEAKNLINEQNPQVVFLDIHMPVKNGFQLLEYYETPLPFSVIFTTAYDQYALKAFRKSAIDYLLKPIEIDALIKAEKHHQSKSDSRRLELPKILWRKVPFKKLHYLR